MSDSLDLDDTPEQAPGEAGAGRRWRPRRLHFHIGLWSVLAMLAVGLFLLLTSLSLTGRAIALPNWVATKVESKLNETMPEGRITLRRIELGVTPQGRPRLRLVDVGLRDGTGLDIAQLNAIEGGVRLAPLLRGRVVPRTAILSGAQVTFRRLADGSFALQFGRGNTTTGNLSQVIDAVDRVFTDGMLREALRVEAIGLTITLEDARTGRLWQVTEGRLSVTQTEQIVETSVAFDVFNQTDELAAVNLALRSAKTDSAASLSFAFTNAAAADIGAQSPALSFFSLIDAPVSGALRTTLAPDGTIANLAGALEIKEGAIKPNATATPVGFGGAKGYLDYEPENSALRLSGLTLTSDLGQVGLDGTLYLTDFVQDWPQAVLGQIRLTGAQFNTPRLFDTPVEVDRGYADLRVTLSPFSLDLGQAVLFRGDTRYKLSGRIAAAQGAWDLALDAEIPEISVEELRAVWPKTTIPNTRDWVFRSVDAGTIHDARVALRGPSLERAQVLLGARISGATVEMMPGFPKARQAAGHISLAQRRLVVAVDEGVVNAPDHPELSLAGSGYTIPDVALYQGPGIADVALEGPAEGALALIALKPFDVFRNTAFGPDVAVGRVQARGQARFDMKPTIPIEDIDFDVAGTVFDVRSDKIVPGSTFTSERMDFTVRPDALEVTGAGRLGAVPLRGSWHQPLRSEDMASGSRLDGTVELGQALVEEFSLGLGADMLSGAAPAAFSLSILPDEPLSLEARSDLRGLALAIPGTGWSKPAASAGELTLRATLGPSPQIDDMTITAPGLAASGTLTTRGGALEAATFSRVRLGNWLDAPVTITGRGARPVAISVRGGRADLREAKFGASGGGGGGPGSPLDIRLDELVISEGIALRDFAGSFQLASGLAGTFTSQVSSGAQITGTVAQTGSGMAYRITADQGGEVLRGINVFNKAQGGTLEVLLAPTGTPGSFEGTFSLNEARLVDAPAMAEILSAISVVGLLDQLDGPGIRFSEVKGRFNLSPDVLTLYSSSAISASVGVSLDGYYNLRAGEMDMQGVLSPFYLVNSLGRLVSARDGEGLVGFSFTLTGPANDLNVGVNPLSILTPGVLREIFRRQAPQQPADK